MSELTRCLKITEKVSFNMASEVSYVCILSGQKFIKIAKNSQFGEFLKFWSLLSNSVTRQVNFNWDKNWCKMPKLKNSNATFLVIFKLCDHYVYGIVNGLKTSGWKKDVVMYRERHFLNNGLLSSVTRRKSALAESRNNEACNEMTKSFRPITKRITKPQEKRRRSFRYFS